MKQLVPSHGIHLTTAVSPYNTLESILEPLDRFLLIDTVACTDLALGPSSLSHSLTRSCPIDSIFSNSVQMFCKGPTTSPSRDSHAAVKVHAVDADRRIILDAQIDVLADAEAEVARL